MLSAGRFARFDMSKHKVAAAAEVVPCTHLGQGVVVCKFGEGAGL
jgi:hypothetical protein